MTTELLYDKGVWCDWQWKNTRARIVYRSVCSQQRVANRQQIVVQMRGSMYNDNNTGVYIIEPWRPTVKSRVARAHAAWIPSSRGESVRARWEEKRERERTRGFRRFFVGGPWLKHGETQKADIISPRSGAWCCASCSSHRAGAAFIIGSQRRLY